MITGVRTLLYSTDSDATRAFLRDVRRLDHVDAGGGWLIFRTDPSELGAMFVRESRDDGWGITAEVEVPGADPIMIYAPRHPISAG